MRVAVSVAGRGMGRGGEQESFGAEIAGIQEPREELGDIFQAQYATAL